MMNKNTFELTEQHLALARKFNFYYVDYLFDAPYVDPINPYGNSDVFSDMAEILNIERSTNHFTKDQYKFMHQIHQETVYALQMGVRGSARPGIYEEGDSVNDWLLVFENPCDDWYQCEYSDAWHLIDEKYYSISEKKGRYLIEEFINASDEMNGFRPSWSMSCGSELRAKYEVEKRIGYGP